MTDCSLWLRKKILRVWLLWNTPRKGIYSPLCYLPWLLGLNVSSSRLPRLLSSAQGMTFWPLLPSATYGYHHCLVTDEATDAVLPSEGQWQRPRNFSRYFITLAHSLYSISKLTLNDSGIGLMMAKALALNGASKVYIIGRREAVLQAAAKESPHNNIIPLVGDVTSKEALSSIVSKIKSEVGYINVLIANSGILGPQPSSKITPETTLKDFQKSMWDIGFEEYSNTFAVNASAVFYSVIAFLELLDEGNRRGNVEQKSQVIATSSIAGFNRKVTGGYAYGPSKAATTHIMKQLATGLVPYGIRANVLAPGCKY